MNGNTFLRVHRVIPTSLILVVSLTLGIGGRGTTFVIPGADGTRLLRHILIAYLPPLACVSLIPLAPDLVGTMFRERRVRVGAETILLALSLSALSVGWLGRPQNQVLSELSMALVFLGLGFIAVARWGLAGIIAVLMTTTTWILVATGVASLLGFGDVTPEPDAAFIFSMSAGGWASLGLAIAFAIAAIPLSTSPRWTRPTAE